VDSLRFHHVSVFPMAGLQHGNMERGVQGCEPISRKGLCLLQVTQTELKSNGGFILPGSPPMSLCLQTGPRLSHLPPTLLTHLTQPPPSLT
jgi:hypothetical protein